LRQICQHTRKLEVRMSGEDQKSMLGKAVSQVREVLGSLVGSTEVVEQEVR